MKFYLTRTTDIMNDNASEIEINTLEELLEFATKNSPHELIITKPFEDDTQKKFQWEIEIYDGYRE